MRYTRFVYFQDLARIQSYLTFSTHYMRKHKWDNLRWNNYYPRCRRCFFPGLCYSCTIPCIYESEQVQWKDRCVTCHTKKQHRSYYLCGSAYCMLNFITIIKQSILPSISVVRDGLLFCEPKPIRLIWLGYNCNDVCRV